MSEKNFLQKKTVSEIIFQAIKIRKIDYVFCVPGESFLSTINSFYGPGKPQLISTRHEEGAGIMAEAYAKSSCKTGVCMVTRGPGLTHLAIALHTAKQDSTPMVVFVGQVPTNFRYREAFQELDIVDFSRSVSKIALEINRADRVSEIVEKAFYIANSGRPGPVVISLPEDIDRSEILQSPALNQNLFFEPSASLDGIEKACEIISKSLRPCIIAGEGVLKKNNSEKLVELAEYLETPVFTAWRRFDAFPNNHRLYMGGLHFSSIRSELSEPIKKADLLIVLGTRLDEFSTMNYSYPSLEQKLIHVYQSPEDTFFNGNNPDLSITSNVGDTIIAIKNNLEKNHNLKHSKDHLNDIKKWRKNYISKTTPRINGKNISAEKVDLERIFYFLVNFLEDETSITCDAGDFGSWLIRFYKWNKPYTFFGPTSGAMGYALPAAISVKLARPKYPAIAFAGDGGFAMTMSELETAVRLNLEGFVVLVFNNSRFGTIKRHQNLEFPGRELCTELSEINFSEIAKAMGARGLRVNNSEGFFKSFPDAINSRCPVLIDIKLEDDNINAWD